MIRAFRHTRIRGRVVVCLIAALLWSERPVHAQLDPLLYLKGQTPKVWLLVDTSPRMQYDADGSYYDPRPYERTGASWEARIGVTTTTTSQSYYRRFVNLRPTLLPLGARYVTDRVETVGDREAGYATFLARTRIDIARRGLLDVVDGTKVAVGFRLVRLGKVAENPNFSSISPVYSNLATQRAAGQTETPGGILGLPPPPGWKITNSINITSPEGLESVIGPAFPSTWNGGNDLIRSELAKTSTIGGLLPLGLEHLGALVAPVGTLVQEVLGGLIGWLQGAPVCQNQAVVMVVGGPDPLSAVLLLVQTLLVTLLNGVLGKRYNVPIHIIAVAPEGAMPLLRAVSKASGGRFTEITKAMIDATTPGQTVPEVLEAMNWAVQQAALLPGDFNLARPADLRALSADHQTVSPVMGTVNLDGALDIEGHVLPGTDVPQRSNVTVTGGFTLPGFAGYLRAFSNTKPAGEDTDALVNDATPLWEAAIPVPESRNIYTVLPNGAVTPFAESQAEALAPYLGGADAVSLIRRVRRQPLGAVIGSTPAFLDPPSMGDAEFRDDNKDRRTLVFVGANDGMMHAFDGRTGLEVWAFIPFNLLPKLRSLAFVSANPTAPIEERHLASWGHGLDDGFRFMVDGSPKLSDVKVDGEWRTYLFFGEGAGGTFYNAVDVTLDRMSDTIGPTSDSANALLSYFAIPARMPFVWSFPALTRFDPAAGTFGDIAAGATDVEKSVGQTWSTPAVARIGDDDGFGVFVGSGYLPYSVQSAPNRRRSGSGSQGVVAGTTFYLLDAATGALLSSRDVGSDGVGENDDSCRAAGNCLRSKNALQMDPSVVTDNGLIDKAYIGDLDGRLWRMQVAPVDGGFALSTPVKIFDAGAADPLYSSMAVKAEPSQTRLFLGTGSDLLPSPDGTSHAYRLLGLVDAGGSTATARFDTALAPVDGDDGDEKVAAFPGVAGNVVFFTTTVYRPDEPCMPYGSNVYAWTLDGGAAVDANGDGQYTTNEAVIYSAATARATAPFVLNGRVAVGVGSGVEVFGEPMPPDAAGSSTRSGVRILSWREVQ